MSSVQLRDREEFAKLGQNIVMGDGKNMIKQGKISSWVTENDDMRPIPQRQGRTRHGITAVGKAGDWAK